MDVEPLLTSGDESGADDFARALELQRARVRRFVAALQERLDRIRFEAATRIELSQQTLDEREQALAEREMALEEAGAAIERRAAECGAGQTEFTVRPGQLTTAASSGRGETLAYTHGSSWEQEKRRILAALEAEGDAVGPQAREERLRIDDVIRITDAAIAEKDCELEQMRQALAARRPAEIGASVAREAVDSDALIRAEREHLRQLQVQWEDMLRTAEIELSQERAKLAREKAEIEEKLRTLTTDAGGAAAGAQKSSRGRRLARLGLKDAGDAGQ